MSLSHNSTIFNATPYYDDFDSSKNYLKMLFRPGRGIQARELSQLQSILQNQVEEFGSHIFEDGSVIDGGEIAETLINYVRVDRTNPLSTDNLNKMVGQKITDGTSTAEVYHVLAGSTLSSDDYEIIFYQHTTQGSFTPGSEIGTTGADHIGVTFGIRTTPTSTDPAPAVASDATLITVNTGVFFVDGYFVENTLQSVAPFNGTTGGTYDYRSFSTPTSSVGWSIDRKVLSSDDDDTLRDPASGFYNYNAPGSDRYNINLTLEQKEFSASLGNSTGLTFDNENFIELVRMVGGSTTKVVRYTDYSDLEETLARRTYDESGNYTVNAPNLTVSDHGDVFSPTDTSKLAISISPNKSYITGYEVETQGSVFLEVDKPRDKAKKNQEIFNTEFGNSLLIGNTYGFGSGKVGADSSKGFNAIDNQSEFTIRDASDTHLGTCRIRTIKRGWYDDTLRAFIYDVALSGGNTFGPATKLVLKSGDGAHTGSTGTWFGITADTNGFTGPFNAGNKSLIYEMSTGTVSEEGMYDPSNAVFNNFILQKQESLHITGGETQGEISLSDYQAVSFTDENQYLVVYGATASAAANLLAGTQYDIVINSADQKTLRVELDNSAGIAQAGGASASVTFPVVWDPSDSSSTPYRTLTINNTTEDVTGTVAEKIFENGITYGQFDLDFAHVKEINSIIEIPLNNSVSVTGDIILDDGNREGVIKNGRLKIKESALNYVDDATTITVNYDYYAHSGYGPVTVDSYVDVFEGRAETYEDIPSFTDKDSGKKYNLRNCVDFRPVKSGATPSVTHFGIPYWNPANPMSTSYMYYLPRIDKVVLGEDRTYKVVKGASAVIPKAPSTGVRDMTMFHLVMNPYVFDKDKDVRVKYVDNQRLTMKQISELDEKVDTSFNDNYIENLRTSAIARGGNNLQSGDKIVEDGIFVDDFSSHAYADTASRNHNCSVNSPCRGLRPPYETVEVKLESDSPSGVNISSDGLCTYNYTAEGAYNDLHSTDDGGNLKATGIVQINPYGATDYLGTLRLEPQVDNFYDTSKNPKVLVNDFGENNSWLTDAFAYQQGIKYGHGSEYEEWTNHWLGEETEPGVDITIDPDNRLYKNPVKPIRFRIPNRVLDTSGSRTVDRSVSHYMQSVGVTFEASGLLPGSTVFALLDGTPIGASGTGYSVGTTGGVIGHVTIPSGTFVTGTKQFRITDSKENTLSETTTVAETNFYAVGSIPVNSDFGDSVRPVVKRRKSTQSSNVITELFDQNQEDNYSSVVRGLEPLAQEIIVDSGAFPQGVFLNDISLYFREVDASTPVTLQIRPMYNGGPHPYCVVPFSEVTVLPTVAFNGPNSASNTSFIFSSPVYLRPGRYAICMLTNSPNNRIFKSTIGDFTLDSDGNTDESAGLYSRLMGTGIGMGSLFFPLNNGSRVEKTDELIAMTINRCKFDGDTNESDRTITFEPSAGSSADAHLLVITGNEPIFSSNTINFTTDVEFVEDSFSGVELNKSIVLNGKKLASDAEDLNVKMKLSRTTGDKISPVIDSQRVSALYVKRCSNYSGGLSGGALGELQPTSAAAGTISRYVSKIVQLDNSIANHIRVFADARIPSGSFQVFVKTDDLEGDFDENSWKQLYTDANGGEEAVPNQNSNVLTYEFKPHSTYDMPPFSRYQIKIVLETPSGVSDLNVTEVKDLRVVPIKKA